MLVTFHSKAWSSITMFGDVAVRLLKLAGHSGTVPSALLAGDIAAALVRMRQGLDTVDQEEANEPEAAPTDESADTPPVGLRLRAYPLIQLLSAAAEQGCDVMWEKAQPAV